MRVQRKIWAAADFQNFLARPNTCRPRKKVLFFLVYAYLVSEKILKIGCGPNFSLHARGSPADRAQARDLSSMPALLFGLRVAVSLFFGQGSHGQQFPTSGWV